MMGEASSVVENVLSKREKIKYPADAKSVARILKSGRQPFKAGGASIAAWSAGIRQPVDNAKENRMFIPAMFAATPSRANGLPPR